MTMWPRHRACQLLTQPLPWTMWICSTQITSSFKVFTCSSTMWEILSSAHTLNQNLTKSLTLSLPWYSDVMRWEEGIEVETKCRSQQGSSCLGDVAWCQLIDPVDPVSMGKMGRREQNMPRKRPVKKIITFSKKKCLNEDIFHFKRYIYSIYSRSCCGSVDKTTDSQSRGPWFESACSGSSALGQGTLSSLPSPSERT